MHVTFLTLGSRGDVMPYAALGSGLRSAGHGVRLITFEDFESVASRRGFEFWPIRGEMRRLIGTPAGLGMTEAGTSVPRMTWHLIHLFRNLAQSFADDLSDPRLRETDLLINQLPAALYGYDLAEAAGIPMMLAAVMPLTPTRAEPMLAFPRWPAPFPGYNLLTHWIAYQIAWGMFRSTIRHWRTETLGLLPPSIAGVWRELQDPRFSVLNACSPMLVPRPPDWGQHVHLTGAWAEDEVDWRPPDALVRFIEAGPPPVYVGFGSMPIRDPLRAVSAVTQALSRVGARAVLQISALGPEPTGLPKGVYPVEELPHAWLFPRMAAAIHHGGSGTTHAGVRAGLPSILAPFVFDQFYWGRRVYELGVGPRPIPFKRLTAVRLVEALDQVLHDDGMRLRASAIGEEVRAEHGVRTALGLIEAGGSFR